MSKFTEIGREDCRFYRGRSCYALKVFDCRLGNKRKFYQPDLSDSPKARTYGADVRYYAETEELRALMDSKTGKVKDMAIAICKDPTTMSKKIKRPKDIRLDRIYSRILERCHPIEVKGVDRRRKKAGSDYDETKKILGM